MKKLEKKFYKHLKERNWHNLRPADMAKSIMIEGGELLELFQWENLSLAEVKKNKQKLDEIKSELADVLIYAIELSVLLGLDTEKIITDKLAHVAKKYPVKLVRGIKEGDRQTQIQKIKKAFKK